MLKGGKKVYPWIRVTVQQLPSINSLHDANDMKKAG